MLIPNELFLLYRDWADELIDNENIGVNCTLYFNHKKQECPNCIFDSFNGKSSNKYKTGGPVEFTLGICPWCHGEGYFSEEYTEVIRLRTYWNKKDWKKFGNIEIPDGGAMIIGYLTDLPKLEKANYVSLVNEQQGYSKFDFNLSGAPILHGFTKNRYFMGTLVKR